MPTYASECTVRQFAHPNPETKIDGNILNLELQPKYMMNKLIAKMVTNFSIFFDLKIRHSQI